MKKTILSVLFSLSALSAMAQSEIRNWQVGVMGTATQSYLDAGLQPFDIQWGRFSVGRRLTSKLMLEAAYSRGFSRISKNEEGDVSLNGSSWFNAIDLNLQYRFSNGKNIGMDARWSPYLQIGPGVYTLPTTDRDQWTPAVNVGAGVDYWLGERWGLGALVSSSFSEQTYLQYAAGLKFRFGKSSQKAAPAPSVVMPLEQQNKPAEPQPEVKAEPQPAVVEQPKQEVAAVPEPAKPEAPAFQEISKTILFGFNDTNLDLKARKDLDAILVELKGMKVIEIIVDGHTDNIGSSVVNQRYALSRASSVKRYLVAQGVDAGKIQLVAKGDKEPQGDNATSVGRAQNRRAVVKLHVK